MSADPENMEYDFAIVGGGIVGLSAAWILNERGYKVVVLEKGRVGGEQSSRNAGFIRLQGRDQREIPMALRASQLWRTFDEALGGAMGLRQTGIISIASDQKQLQGLSDWAASASAFGLENRLLTPSQLSQAIPQLKCSYEGGLLTPTDSYAEPELASIAMAKGLRERGGKIFESCMVEGIETSAGRVSGLATERGTVRASKIVIAAGIWASALLERYGVVLPLNQLRVSLARSEPFDHGITRPLWLPDVLVRPRHDGGLTFGPGTRGPFVFDVTLQGMKLAPRFVPALFSRAGGVEISLNGHLFEEPKQRRAYIKGNRADYDGIRVPEPEPTQRILDRCLAAIDRNFDFGDRFKVAQSWAGRIDVTPDSVPAMGTLKQLPGAVLVTGMSGHGFGAGPALGEIAADLAEHGSSALATADFAIERFAEHYFLKPQSVL